MSDPALSPAQLDRLEDALEDLELEGIPSALLDPDDDDARGVADTLEVYRSILVMSRKALPTEDVPAGLLDDVLAQARRVAASPAKAPARTPWYRRLGGWGPALAFAGTAALLLVLVRPPGEDEAASGPIARADRAREVADDAPLAAAPASVEPAADPEAPPAEEEEAEGRADLDGLRLAEARGRDEPANAFDDPLDDWAGEAEADERGAAARTEDAEKKAKTVSSGPAAGGQGYDPGTLGGAGTTSRKKTSSASGGTKEQPVDKKPRAEPKPAPPSPNKGAPGASGSGVTPIEPSPTPASPPPAEAPPPKTKADEDPTGWADVTSGDAKRRSGSCGSANVAYQRVKSDPSAEIRARALAGLGLCELQAGNASAADAYFKKARAADPKVAKFIEAERPLHEPDQAPLMADEADE